MTASSWEKITKQLKNKPAKLKKFLKHNKPKVRKNGIACKTCENCGRIGAHVGQYGINMCRQCFRELATDLGFRKYS